jgi:ketosteroid isomerase-like protein
MCNPNEIQVVAAFIAAINRHDVTELGSLMTDDHTFVDPAGRIQSGRETMLAGWKGYFQMFPDFKIDPEKTLADGNLVAVFGSASGTYNGKRGMVAENKISMPAAWQVVVENSRIKSWQVYADWTEGCQIMAEDQKAS